MPQFLFVFFSLGFQEASKRSNNWLPPPWAIVALLVLGFNEFMTLLRYFLLLQNENVFYIRPSFTLGLYFILGFLCGRNPLWLGFIFVAYLLMKALWVQLDISGEFRNGAVSAAPITLFVFLCAQHIAEAEFIVPRIANSIEFQL